MALTVGDFLNGFLLLTWLAAVIAGFVIVSIALVSDRRRKRRK